MLKMSVSLSRCVPIWVVSNEIQVFRIQSTIPIINLEGKIGKYFQTEMRGMKVNTMSCYTQFGQIIKRRFISEKKSSICQRNRFFNLKMLLFREFRDEQRRRTGDTTRLQFKHRVYVTEPKLESVAPFMGCLYKGEFD